LTDPRISNISVIIPTLNEENELGRLLASLKRFQALEIIVADGGSTDQTVAVAEHHGIQVVATLPRRGRQLNKAVQHASGQILVFLHSDTTLPLDFADHIHTQLERPGTAAGAFRLQIDAPGTAYRLIEWGANLRSRLASLPYGDQAIFVRKALLLEAGGMPDQPIMEDIELVRRLKRFGKIRIAQAAAVTSARRWQKKSLVATTLVNQLMLAGYLLHIDREILRKFYYRTRRRDRL